MEKNYGRMKKQALTRFIVPDLEFNKDTMFGQNPLLGQKLLLDGVYPVLFYGMSEECDIWNNRKYLVTKTGINKFVFAYSGRRLAPLISAADEVSTDWHRILNKVFSNVYEPTAYRRGV